ncbi:MAG: hypothetical protein R6W93_03790 [Candidatus Limnocylindrales bacterium]
MDAGSITRAFACTRWTSSRTSSASWGRVALATFSAIDTMILRLRSKATSLLGSGNSASIALVSFIWRR